MEVLMNDVKLGDFCPYNRWSEVEVHSYDGQDVVSAGNIEKITNVSKQYLMDETTGRAYLLEDPGKVRAKCAALVVFSPVIYLISSIINVAHRALKLITLDHFQIRSQKEAMEPYDFKARLSEAAVDVLRISTAHISFIGLELAAIYGVFNPYDGRKLYASIERATYGCVVLPWCFQPSSRPVFKIADKYYTLPIKGVEKYSVVCNFLKKNVDSIDNCARLLLYKDKASETWREV